MNAVECVFCRIASGEIPSDFVHKDQEFLAFRDIHPQAPTHIIVIPRAHIRSLNELRQEHEGLMGRLILLARELAQKEGVADAGYRLAINCGPQGGQVVQHLHLHLLGGRELTGRLG